MRKRFRLVLSAGLLLVFLSYNGFAQQSASSENDLKKQADKAFTAENYETALNPYSQLLSLHPTDVNLNYRFGVCLLLAGKEKANAASFLENASKSQTVPVDVWYFLGRAYMVIANFNGAIYALEKYSALKPKQKKNDVEALIANCKNANDLRKTPKQMSILDEREENINGFYTFFDFTNAGGRLVPAADQFLTSADQEKQKDPVMFITNDKQTIYISSYGKRTDQGKDLYVIRKMANGQWSEPQNLGTTVNSPLNEDYPALDRDGRTLYFASKGYNSIGGYDIFKSVLDLNSGQWSVPENLGIPVNTIDDDMFFLTDGKGNRVTYATTNRAEKNKLNIRKAELPGIASSMVRISGVYTPVDQRVRRDARISVLNSSGEGIIATVFTDPRSGNYELVLPPGKEYMIVVEGGGYLPHAEMFNLPEGVAEGNLRQVLKLNKTKEKEEFALLNYFSSVEVPTQTVNRSYPTADSSGLVAVKIQNQTIFVTPPVNENAQTLNQIPAEDEDTTLVSLARNEKKDKYDPTLERGLSADEIRQKQEEVNRTQEIAQEDKTATTNYGVDISNEELAHVAYTDAAAVQSEADSIHLEAVRIHGYTETKDSIAAELIESAINAKTDADRKEQLKESELLKAEANELYVQAVELDTLAARKQREADDATDEVKAILQNDPVLFAKLEKKEKAKSNRLLSDLPLAASQKNKPKTSKANASSTGSSPNPSTTKSSQTGNTNANNTVLENETKNDLALVHNRKGAETVEENNTDGKQSSGTNSTPSSDISIEKKTNNSSEPVSQSKSSLASEPKEKPSGQEVDQNIAAETKSTNTGKLNTQTPTANEPVTSATKQETTTTASSGSSSPESKQSSKSDNLPVESSSTVGNTTSLDTQPATVLSSEGNNAVFGTTTNKDGSTSEPATSNTNTNSPSEVISSAQNNATDVNPNTTSTSKKSSPTVSDQGLTIIEIKPDAIRSAGQEVAVNSSQVKKSSGEVGEEPTSSNENKSENSSTGETNETKSVNQYSGNSVSRVDSVAGNVVNSSAKKDLSNPIGSENNDVNPNAEAKDTKAADGLLNASDEIAENNSTSTSQPSESGSTQPSPKTSSSRNAPDQMKGNDVKQGANPQTINSTTGKGVDQTIAANSSTTDLTATVIDQKEVSSSTPNQKITDKGTTNTKNTQRVNDSDHTVGTPADVSSDTQQQTVMSHLPVDSKEKDEVTNLKSTNPIDVNNSSNTSEVSSSQSNTSTNVSSVQNKNTSGSIPSESSTKNSTVNSVDDSIVENNSTVEKSTGNVVASNSSDKKTSTNSQINSEVENKNISESTTTSDKSVAKKSLISSEEPTLVALNVPKKVSDEQEINASNAKVYSENNSTVRNSSTSLSPSLTKPVDMSKVATSEEARVAYDAFQTMDLVSRTLSDQSNLLQVRIANMRIGPEKDSLSRVSTEMTLLSIKQWQYSQKQLTDAKRLDPTVEEKVMAVRIESARQGEVTQSKTEESVASRNDKAINNNNISSEFKTGNTSTAFSSENQSTSTSTDISSTDNSVNQQNINSNSPVETTSSSTQKNTQVEKASVSELALANPSVVKTEEISNAAPVEKPVKLDAAGLNINHPKYPEYVKMQKKVTVKQVETIDVFAEAVNLNKKATEEKDAEVVLLDKAYVENDDIRKKEMLFRADQLKVKSAENEKLAEVKFKEAKKRTNEAKQLSAQLNTIKEEIKSAPVLADNKSRVTPAASPTTVSPTLSTSRSLSSILSKPTDDLRVTPEQLANEPTPSSEAIAEFSTASFSRSSTPVYSERNPIPMDVSLPEGLVFKVQIGAFRTPLSADRFKGVQPLTGESTRPGWIRYCVGLFKTFDPANEVKKEMRVSGFKDAFVVAYFNGERIGLNEAYAMLNTNKEMKSSYQRQAVKEMALLSAINITPSVSRATDNNDEQSFYANSVSENKTTDGIDEIIYTVQIGVYRSSVVPNALASLTPIEATAMKAGLFRFTYGVYDYYATADSAKRIAVSSGVKDAFIIAYKNGKRVSAGDLASLSDKKSILNEPRISSTLPATSLPSSPKPTSSQPIEKDLNMETPVIKKNVPVEIPVVSVEDNQTIVYKVQLGAFRQMVPFERVEAFLRVSDKGITQQTDERGLHIFYAGNCADFACAQALKQEIISKGISDAFIVPLRGNKRIPLTDELKK